MPSITYDIEFLEAGLDELEAYLLSDTLYWRTGASAPPGEPEFPSLTLGGLLLARQRLAAQPLNGSERQFFDRLLQRLENSQSKWRVAWGRKARQSFNARLTQWNNYMADYLAQPEAYAQQYPTEVRVRIMIALLQPLAEDINPSAIELLNSLDTLLRVRLQPGPFVWDAALAEGFPTTTYWYLYGHLKE